MKFLKAFLYSTLIIGVFGIYRRKGSECDFHRLNQKELLELQQFCGTALIDTEQSKRRISFGLEAKQGQFPWAVYQTSFGGGACTGTVISKYHILTAAHCFQGDEKKQEFEIKDYNVRENGRVLAGTPCVYREPLNKQGIDGSINCSRNEFKKPRELSVSSLIIPKDSVAYWTQAPNSVYSDFAIIELSKPLQLNDIDIRPICLPKPDTKIPNELEFYGYGDISQKTDPVNEQLFWGSDNVYNLKDAGRSITVYHQRIKDLSICHGDSGGGLTASINDQNYIFGITSYSTCYCDNNARPYNTTFFNVLMKHDFICYYTGICPLGYNKYIDPNYPNHPEKVAYLSDGDGKSLIGPEDTTAMVQFCNDIGKKCIKNQSKCNRENNKNYFCVKTCNDNCYMGSPYGLRLRRVAGKKKPGKANGRRRQVY